MTRNHVRNAQRIIVSALLCVGTAAIVQSQAFAQEAEQLPDDRVAEIASAVEKANTNEASSTAKVPSTSTPSGFEALSNDMAVTISQNPSEGVTLTKQSSGGNQSITIGIADSAQHTGELANDGSVVFQGNNRSTSHSVQVMEEGVQIHNVMENADAPIEFVHKLTLPEGAKLLKASEVPLSSDDAATAGESQPKVDELTNGAQSSDPFVIVDQDNKLIGGFAEPWAKDAKGAEVPTSYEVRGNSLVQKVDHKQENVQYPVVADPYFGKDLIKSAAWTESEDGWTLEVTPTNWARKFAGGYLPGAAGWDELLEKYRDDGRGITINLDGLRDQYICHQQVVAIVEPEKPTWNIDEWRPDVSYLQTVNERCNPGSDNPIID